MSQGRLYIAANNGDIGGGEVMLLAIAEAARTLGKNVVIMAPSRPDRVIVEARKRAFETVEIPSKSRLKYMVELRKWRKRNGAQSLLWCNGLLPAVATGGLKHRIVHLHQIPSGWLRLVLPFARLGATTVLVPSTHMKSVIERSELFPNWSDEVRVLEGVAESSGDEIRIGFIGRFSSDKGLPVLIDAMNMATRKSDQSFRLVLAGGPKFVDVDDQRRISKSIESSEVPIDFLGWVEPEVFFSNIHLAVVPSVWAEPFGLVATEAMSAQVPLIVSEAGALPEIVGEGYPWISKAGNSESLLETILQVTQTPMSQKEIVVKEAFKRWELLYSPAAGRESVRGILQRSESE